MRFRSELRDSSGCCLSHVTVRVEGFNVERGKVSVFVVLEFRVCQSLFKVSCVLKSESVLS